MHFSTQSVTLLNIVIHRHALEGVDAGPASTLDNRRVVTDHVTVFIDDQVHDATAIDATKQNMFKDPAGYFGVHGVTQGWKPLVMFEIVDGCASQNKCVLAFYHLSRSELDFGCKTGARFYTFSMKQS